MRLGLEFEMYANFEVIIYCSAVETLNLKGSDDGV
jgi:hypothetical protein